ncbi:MAG TPA: GNAT family N-acetyltransferase [Natronosporangium sp.]
MSWLPDAGPRLQFFADPGEFLAVAEEYLAADPVVNTVVTTVTHQLAQPERRSRTDRNWWVVVREGSGAIVGAGMRTAPFAPRPLFLLPMPDAAAVAVANALHERGEEATAVNGALPAAQLCAAELARLAGGRAEIRMRTRLHELGGLTWPAPAPGRLQAASADDVDLVMAWLAAFVGDADEQAARPRGASAHELPDRAELLRRLRAGYLWFWVDEHGEPVHLTGFHPPSFGVARIGPVYTPPDQRGRGLASNAIAAISQRLQAEGVRVCLYTDQANPTSNKVYARLGFRPVVDMASLVVVR